MKRNRYYIPVEIYGGRWELEYMGSNWSEIKKEHPKEEIYGYDNHMIRPKTWYRKNMKTEKWSEFRYPDEDDGKGMKWIEIENKHRIDSLNQGSWISDAHINY